MTKEESINVFKNLFVPKVEDCAQWLLNYGVDEETIQDLLIDKKAMTEQVGYLILSNFEINLPK